MILKKIVFCLISLILSISTAFSEKTSYCRIVIYRINPSIEDVSAYKIESNSTLLTELKNKSYFAFYMPEGDLKIKAYDKVSDELDVHIVKNTNYFIRLDVKTEGTKQSAKLVVVDSIEARNELLSCKIPDARNPASQNRFYSNGIGISLGAGWGFHNTSIITTTDNYHSTISYGGGFDLMGVYTREFNEYFGIDFEVSVQESFLMPALTNASATFSRGRFSVNPFFILPLNADCTKRLKIGAGLDYYFSTVLSLETEKLINGMNAMFYYNQPLGYHFSCIYEQFFNRNLSARIGGKLSDVKYKFESSDSNWYPTDNTFSNPSGLTLYFLLGIGYHF